MIFKRKEKVIEPIKKNKSETDIIQPEENKTKKNSLFKRKEKVIEPVKKNKNGMEIIQSEESKTKKLALFLAKYLFLFGADRFYQRKYISAYFKIFMNCLFFGFIAFLVTGTILSKMHNVTFNTSMEWIVIGSIGLGATIIWDITDVILIKKNGAYREERLSFKERGIDYINSFKIKKDKK